MIPPPSPQNEHFTPLRVFKNCLIRPPCHMVKGQKKQEVTGVEGAPLVSH